MTIRVVLIDDQTLVRQGIRSLLELHGDIEVVGEASDGDEAELLLRSTNAEVALLDVRMPRKSGLEVLEAMRGQGPACVLLTTFDDDAVALQGIRLGARGFLLKDVTLEDLVEAVKAVASGGTTFKPGIGVRAQQRLAALSLPVPSAELPESLTPRELEVLRFVAAGHSNREIAEVLGSAEGTVKNQTSSILSKLGVRDRTRAVLRALELGIL